MLDKKRIVKKRSEHRSRIEWKKPISKSERREKKGSKEIMFNRIMAVKATLWNNERLKEKQTFPRLIEKLVKK